MTIQLDTLELTPEMLDSSREAVRKMAYFKWLDAGCPSGRDLDFWAEAERQWIGHCYVPNRRPAATKRATADRERQSEPTQGEPRRPAKRRALSPK